jgi:hypothetical protein
MRRDCPTASPSRLSESSCTSIWRMALYSVVIQTGLRIEPGTPNIHPST